MLPHVQLQDGNCALRRVALLVKQLLDNELLSDGVPGKHAPPGSLDAQRRGLEMGLESVERAKELIQGFSDLSFRSSPRARRKVGPKNRVINVPTEVEGKVFLEPVDVGEVARLPSFRHLGERVIRSIYISLVVFRVVKLHNASTDVGLKSRVIIGKFG